MTVASLLNNVLKTKKAINEKFPNGKIIKSKMEVGLDQCWAYRGFGEAASVSVIKKVNEAAGKVLGVNTFEGC